MCGGGGWGGGGRRALTSSSSFSLPSPGQQRKRDWPFPPRPGAQVDPRSWVQEVTEPGINTRRHSLHLLVSFLLPRPTMNPLQEVIFCRQFGNQHRVPKPYYRRKTYLCYQLKLPEGTLIHKDCLRNKVPTQGRLSRVSVSPAPQELSTVFLSPGLCRSCSLQQNALPAPL